MVAARQDPRHDDTVPPEPIVERSVAMGIAHRWMEVSLGYHERLPRLEQLQKEDRETLRDTRSIALEARGILVMLEETVSSIAEKLEVQVRARPSLPHECPTLDLEVTQHGTPGSARVPIEQVEAVQRFVAEQAKKLEIKEAEDRGRKIQISELKEERDDQAKKEKRFREWVVFGIAVGGAIATVAAWCFGHFVH
jgi:hypothetical protein